MEAVNHTDEKQAVARNSIYASLLMTLGKFAVGVQTGSLGIISEAIHSALDFVSTIITYIAVKFSDLPPDDNHHYGHKKIESIAALITTGLLFATSAWVMWEALSRLIFGGGHSIEVTWYAVGVIALSIAIDIHRSRALMRTAKSTGSQALEADALHFQSDIWSSTVVLVGLLCTYFHVPAADSISAILVSLFIAHAGYELGKRTVDVLTDAAPAGVSERIMEIVSCHSLLVSSVRVRTEEGETIITEIGIEVPSLMEAKDILEAQQVIERAVQAEYPRAKILLHIEKTI